MFNINRENGLLSFKIASNSLLMHQIIEECTHHLEGYDGSRIIELSVVLRELLRNAIIHGNKSCPALTVKCMVENRGAGKIKITVQDQGNGFDYGKVKMNLPEAPGRLDKRGLKLINALSDRIEFNDKGNHVSVYMTLSIQEQSIKRKSHKINERRGKNHVKAE